LHQLSLGGE
jgi:hypothetical protein